MQQLIPTPSPTLGQYLFDSLKAEGITEVFGVPGDYNFSLLDTLEQYEGIRFINGRNELGAGYASDGYGRLRGLSALITTFGVGEMSACNTIAGANSEYVPLVHIVGAPKSMDQQAHKLVHHSLLNGDFDVFRQDVYASVRLYSNRDARKCRTGDSSSNPYSQTKTQAGLFDGSYGSGHKAHRPARCSGREKNRDKQTSA